ncbi:NRDE family protein [Salibacterium salarium]|uniref:NRDE family protein n=1 Tax=Salibacterium salarium TaxID=284579 RepID=A0A3R9Q4Z8_9BACI|nr:NRDE family protein [Salibacterium salarium]RSL33753.1 NRDE family protein [Salibacterium salarium]
MCLIICGYHVHEDFPLIIAANRDEFYARPADSLHCWPDSPIIAGRDKAKGGTWMGVTESGRFAAITNVRNPYEAPSKKSRGNIVKDYLETEKPDVFLENCNKNGNQYGGYNFIGGNLDELLYTTNQNNYGKYVLTSGVYGLSNAFLDTPWPKVEKAKTRFSHILKDRADHLTCDVFFDMLTDTKQAEVESLPNTGVELSLEQQLSPLFINMKEYGTRSQTVLMVSKGGSMIMEEKTYREQGILDRHTRIEI